MPPVRLIAFAVWMLWVLLAWMLAGLLKLDPADRKVFTAAFSIIGAIAAVLVVWWLEKKRSQKALPTGDDRMSLLVREAANRLATSPGTPAKRLSDLPAVLLVGEAGSAKTSAVVRAGINEALLAGNVWNGQLVAPTVVSNLWLAGQWLVAEIGGAALEDAPGVRRLLDALRAAKASKLFGASAQAPRGLIVAADLSLFYQRDAAGIQAAARKLRGVLTAAAAAWGSRCPVYVLFTKLDAVPFFHDFVRQMDNAEGTRFFGARLHFTTSGAAVWDQQETARLQNAFDQLFLRLDQWRREMLLREAETGAAPNIYEFPREFRKLREPIVRFLLDLTRPNPLEATPLLRGFYFSGVRPIVIETSQPQAAPQAAAPAPILEDAFAATMITPTARAQQPPPPPLPMGGAKRVPQWTFLPEFFASQVFDDRGAMRVSSQFTGAATARKIMLGAACALAGIYFLGATISFINNFRLTGQVQDAASTLARVSGPALTPPQAQALEQLRDATEKVSHWQREGAPFFHRWGVYPGLTLHDNTRTAYCKVLDRVVLSSLRDNLRQTLSVLPATPGSNDQYDPSYRALKAYLMMTSEAKHAQAGFLGRELQMRAAGLPASGIDFREHLWLYAKERQSGFCGAASDANAIQTARSHLVQFPLRERLYRSIVAELDARFPKASFTDAQRTIQFTDSATKRVSNTGEVSGAFTKAAFPMALELIRQSSSGAGQEDWVLGPEGRIQDASNLGGDLRTMYLKDYVGRWEAFLNSASVVRYANLKDAAAKLKVLSSAQTPLLGPFCLAAQNTSVEAGEIKAAFKPILALSADPSTCTTTPIGEKTKGYSDGLISLWTGVQRVAEAPASEAALPESAGAQAAALTLARDLALPPTTSDYLLQPITYADELVKSKLPSDLNGAGASACAQITPVLRKVPFAAQGPPASIQEVNAVFQPGTGLLSTFAQQQLAQYLTLIGERYSPAAGAKIQVSDAFLNYFNRAHAIGRSLYRANPAGNPGFTYSLRAEPSENLPNFELRIDGQSLKGTRSGGQSQEFKYPGDGSGVHVILDGKEISTLAGPWAVFEFFRQANRQPGPATFEWDLATQTTFGRATTSGGRSAVLRVTVDYKGGYALFGKPGLEITCVSRVAK
jgi:type VI secretion system protein ImpL